MADCSVVVGNSRGDMKGAMVVRYKSAVAVKRTVEEIDRRWQVHRPGELEGPRSLQAGPGPGVIVSQCAAGNSFQTSQGGEQANGSQEHLRFLFHFSSDGRSRPQYYISGFRKAPQPEQFAERDHDIHDPQSADRTAHV